VQVSSLIEALPADLTLTLVDVGSAGGTHSRWDDFRPLLSNILFDPREAAATGSFGRSATRVYPVALGEAAGEAELFLTEMVNMSSFLEPDPEQFGRYGKKSGDSAVTATEMVKIERLDDLAERDGFKPDVLKVDTQGSELLVLKGARSALQSVILAEIEVSFFARYKGQPLFADIEAFMNAQGFELIDLLKLKRYRADNSFGIRNAGLREGERSGRLAYADAIFLRREALVLEIGKSDGGQSVLRAVVALVAYGKADLAARLLDVGRDMIGLARAVAIGEAIRSLPSPRRKRLISRLLGKVG
jgi:FkbM family methyltransferase